MNARTVCFIVAGLLALAIFKGGDWNQAVATPTQVTTGVSGPASDTGAVCTCPNCGCTYSESAASSSTVYHTVGYGSAGTSGYVVSGGSYGTYGSAVSGGYVSGWRSYGGPVRKIRARRLARIESWGGPRAAYASARLGNMNCRYCN